MIIGVALDGGTHAFPFYTRDSCLSSAAVGVLVGTQQAVTKADGHLALLIAGPTASIALPMVFGYYSTLRYALADFSKPRNQ